MMKKPDPNIHPYHYWQDKNFIQHCIDWAVPIGLFLLYFAFYNFGKFTSHEMVKTSGLMAISLLAFTLLVGPLSWCMPFLNVLKAHRKFWGILSFLFAALHVSLVVIFYWHFDLSKLVDLNNPKFSGLFAGAMAFAILLVITLTSNQKALQGLSPKVWKAIQITSYIALALAVAHFYLMEQVDGALIIKRSLGRITFWFAVAVILIRLAVLLLPKKKQI